MVSAMDGSLLTVGIKISDTVILPFGSSDLGSHTGRNALSENPHLAAFAHNGIAEEQSKFPFTRISIIHELRKEQMHGDGDISAVNSEPAVPLCVGDRLKLRFLSLIRSSCAITSLTTGNLPPRGY